MKEASLYFNLKSKIQNLKLLMAAALVLSASPAIALDYPVLSPDPDAFAARREKFMAQLPPNSIAVLRSGPQRTMSNDTGYVYRQDSDFYYLTGIDEKDVTAVFRPNAADHQRYVLFMPPRDVRREAWVGVRVGPDEAVKAYGADAAFPSADFNGKMRVERGFGEPVGGYLTGIDKLYLSDGGDTEWLAKFRIYNSEMQALRRLDTLEQAQLKTMRYLKSRQFDPLQSSHRCTETDFPMPLVHSWNRIQHQQKRLLRPQLANSSHWNTHRFLLLRWGGYLLK